MKIYENGIYRDMTAEEIEAMNQHQANTPDPTPTIEDRLAKVEEDSSVIRAILLGEGE